MAKLKDETHNKAELIADLADDVRLLMIYVDILSLKYQIADIEKIISDMDRANSYLEAWPFPETMRKAEIMTAQTTTFKRLIDLVKARKTQLEIQHQISDTASDIVLKGMGLK
jgi:hypothetical protein